MGRMAAAVFTDYMQYNRRYSACSRCRAIRRCVFPFSTRFPEVPIEEAMVLAAPGDAREWMADMWCISARRGDDRTGRCLVCTTSTGIYRREGW